MSGGPLVPWPPRHVETCPYASEALSEYVWMECCNHCLNVRTLWEGHRNGAVQDSALAALLAGVLGEDGV